MIKKASISFSILVVCVLGVLVGKELVFFVANLTKNSIACGIFLGALGTLTVYIVYSTVKKDSTLADTVNGVFTKKTINVFGAFFLLGVAISMIAAGFAGLFNLLVD